MYKYSLEEQETAITICAADADCFVFTAIPAHIRKLKSMAERFPDSYKVTKEDQYGIEVSVSKKLIRFASPASEARREASRRNAAGALAKAREARQHI